MQLLKEQQENDSEEEKGKRVWFAPQTSTNEYYKLSESESELG